MTEPLEAMCSFYVRTQVSDAPTYRYDRVEKVGRDGFLYTSHPPLNGDLVHLPGGTYRVIERAWGHSAYGSMNWPLARPKPISGPLLDLIVEVAEGPFVHEAEQDEVADDGR